MRRTPGRPPGAALTRGVARSALLALHRTAVLRHDEVGQETLLNLLLRNYLHYNLYDQARPRPARQCRPRAPAARAMNPAWGVGSGPSAHGCGSLCTRQQAAGQLICVK
jgi:hypothetical protein